MSYSKSRSYGNWQSEVVIRFLDCCEYLIQEGIVQSEEELIYSLEENIDFFVDLEKLNKFISVRILFYCYYKYNISTHYILYGDKEPFVKGSGIVKNITEHNRNFLIRRIRKNPEHFVATPYRHISWLLKYTTTESTRNTPVSVYDAYVWRQILWRQESKLAHHYREVSCIWDQKSLFAVLKNRGYNLKNYTEESILIEGDRRENCLVTSTAHVNIPLEIGMEKVLIKLETDPTWFWPDPNFFYVALIGEYILTGLFEPLREPEYIVYKPIAETNVELLDRKDIRAIWRVERFI